MTRNVRIVLALGGAALLYVGWRMRHGASIVPAGVQLPRGPLDTASPRLQDEPPLALADQVIPLDTFAPANERAERKAARRAEEQAKRAAKRSPFGGGPTPGLLS
jgi:hypothetical protein